MCSSNIVYSSESARGVRVEKCGEVTQDICVEIVDVNYVCECDMPASEDARQLYVIRKSKTTSSGMYIPLPGMIYH